MGNLTSQEQTQVGAGRAVEKRDSDPHIDDDATPSAGAFLLSSDEGARTTSGEGEGNATLPKSQRSQSDDLVPTVFQWVQGGQSVYLTGTFNNWQEREIEMHRSRNDFTYICNLTRDKHIYKFIVDGEDRFAPDQPTITDQKGNIFNVVDLNEFRSTLDDAQTFRRDAPGDSEYSQIIPELHEYTQEPPPLPPHLRHIILNQYLQNVSPEAMPVPQHVTLNHLYCTAIRGGLVVLASTQRYREKFVTAITYSMQDKELSRVVLKLKELSLEKKQKGEGEGN